jgi:hypothetical protein
MLLAERDAGAALFARLRSRLSIVAAPPPAAAAAAASPTSALHIGVLIPQFATWPRPVGRFAP